MILIDFQFNYKNIDTPYNNSLLMQEQQKYSKYKQISQNFKNLIDSVTTFEFSQLKNFLLGIEKKIQKNEQSYSDYESLKNYLDSTKQAKGKVFIHFACARGNVEIVDYLINTLKLDATCKDKQGNTPFLTAIQHCHLPLVQYFVEEMKFSVNTVKDGNISCLHLSCNQNSADLINYLIAKGADIERVSIYGKPINWAVGSRNYEGTKILLDHGASPEGDSTGSSLSPLILAIDYEAEDIYQLLIEKGANINCLDPNGYNLVHLAAQKGNLKLVKFLIEKGCKIFETEGKSPLYLAFEHQKWDVVNYLKSFEHNFEQIQKKVKDNDEKNSKVVIDKPKAEEIKAYGNQLYNQKQYEPAIAKYKEALQYDPDNEVIHRNLAACQLALKNYNEALYHCCIAKKTGPNNVKTLYREAQAFIGLGNLIDASSSLWQCSYAEPSNAFFKQQFMKYVDLAKKKHAEQNKK